MKLTRRKTIALTASAVAVGFTKSAAATDITTDKIPPRMSLKEFVKDQTLLDAFRRGVRAMKKRPPSDPLSWFFQAAIHGVTSDMIAEAKLTDANIGNVDQKLYWNQCPHFGQESANFLPWHRAYTHYFERILRAHTQEPRFALPFWDYSDKEYRLFPRELGISTLDEPLDGDSDNPLYHSARNLFFTEWEHWSGEVGPYSQLTDLAVDWSPAENSPVFFGSTDGKPDEKLGIGGNVGDSDTKTRGRMESFPHDPIHRMVGGVVGLAPHPDPDKPGSFIDDDSANGGMAFPPTAGFDPAFCVHHSNIDRLWAQWSYTPGKQWGMFPDPKWFDETPWSFFDVAVVNGSLQPVPVTPKPRKHYFDYRALGISFVGEDLSKTPLKLPDPIPPPSTPTKVLVASLGTVVAPTSVSSIAPERVKIALAGTSMLNTFAKTIANTGGEKARPTQMRIVGIKLDTIASTGYEVYLTDDPQTQLTRNSPGFLGTIALFRHDGPIRASSQVAETGAMEGMEHGEASDVFDIGPALQALGQTDVSNLQVVIKPFSLAETTKDGERIIETGAMTFDRIEFFSS